MKKFSNTSLLRKSKDKCTEKGRRLEVKKMKGERAINFTGVLLQTTSPLKGTGVEALGPKFLFSLLILFLSSSTI